MASSSSPISTATNVSYEGQEYKIPHKVDQHQVCFLFFDNERAGFRVTKVFLSDKGEVLQGAWECTGVPAGFTDLFCFEQHKTYT